MVRASFSLTTRSETDPPATHVAGHGSPAPSVTTAARVPDGVVELVLLAAVHLAPVV